MYVYICWRCLIFVWIIVRGTDKSGTVKIFVLLEILVKKKNMALEILLRLTFFFFNKPLDIFWSKENCKKKFKNLKHIKNFHGTWGLDRF